MEMKQAEEEKTIIEQANAAEPITEAVLRATLIERVCMWERATIDDTKCKTNLYIKNKIEAMIQSAVIPYFDTYENGMKWRRNHVQKFVWMDAQHHIERIDDMILYE